MSAVEFGNAAEPWSVGRGKTTRWLHCQVDVTALADAELGELTEWFEARELPEPGPVVVVTRGDDGHRVHSATGAVDVDIAELPEWMQRPNPAPAKATSLARGRAGRDRTDRSRPA